MSKAQLSIPHPEPDGLDPFPLLASRLGVERVSVIVGSLREDELMRPFVDDGRGGSDTPLSILDAVLGQIQRVFVPEVVAFRLADEQHFVEEEDVPLTGHSIFVGFDGDLTVALKFAVVGQGSVLFFLRKEGGI